MEKIFIDWNDLKKAVSNITASGKTRRWLDKSGFKTLQRVASKQDLFKQTSSTNKVAVVDTHTLDKLITARDFMLIAEKHKELHPRRLASLRVRDEKASEKISFKGISVDRLVKLHNVHIREYNSITSDFTINLTNEDERVVWRNDDGFYLVELISTDAFDNEGNAMGHCLNGSTDYWNRYVNGKIRLYSLRRKGKSHVTFEINKIEREIKQLQGKSNKDPHPKYAKAVSECVVDMKWKSSNKFSKNTGILNDIHGNPHSIHNIPDNAFFDATITLDGSTFPNIKIPKNISGTGIIIKNMPQLKALEGYDFNEVHIEFCDNLETINIPDRTQKITVKGCKSFKTIECAISIERLSIRDCESFENLPEDVVVRSGVYLENLNKLKDIPKSFRVIGNLLQIDSCPQLEWLNESISTESLYVRRCDNFKGFNSQINISYKIEISACKSFYHIPEGQFIRSYLNISNCESFKRLNDGIVFLKDVTFSGLDYLEYIGDNITLYTSFSIKSCENLKSIGKNFRCYGNFQIGDLDSLENIGSNLFASRKVDIMNCPKLKSIDGFNNMMKPSKIKITSCPELKDIPESINSIGDIILKDLGIETLPSLYSSKGRITLMKLDSIESIDADIKADHGLDIADCSNLKTIGNEITVENGYFNIENCSSFESIGDDYDIESNFIIKRCPKFNTIGRNFYAGGDAYLVGLEDLETIKDGFTVGGRLDMIKCPNLKNVPDDLSVASARPGRFYVDITYKEKFGIPKKLRNRVRYNREL